VSESP
ncbi:hypothetical protein VCHC72A2_02669B, partial [Vibrio cholerae HC-72A2]